MPEKAFTEPSPSDWDRWEARLLDGEEPSQAARAEGQTCSSFRRNDASRHGAALEMSREIRVGEDREYVRDKLKANVDQAMRAVPVFDREGNETGEYTYQGAVANKSLELLGRGAGMFEETTRVEVTGGDGGPVQIEDRSASLADVARVLESVGALAQLSRGTPERALPAAREVLAESLDG